MPAKGRLRRGYQRKIIDTAEKSIVRFLSRECKNVDRKQITLQIKHSTSVYIIIVEIIRKIYFMKKLILLTLLFSTAIQFHCLYAQELPQLKHEGNKNRLYVDGKPFIMVAGELHNSTSSNLTYLAPIFPKLKEMGLNTVIASVAWEQFEPQEGKFDYSQIGRASCRERV